MAYQPKPRLTGLINFISPNRGLLLTGAPLKQRPVPSPAYPLIAGLLFSVIGITFPIAFIGAAICAGCLWVDSDRRALDKSFAHRDKQT